jgi:hypothetical protein
VKTCRSPFDALRTSGKAVEFSMNLFPFVVSLSNHEWFTLSAVALGRLVIPSYT